MFFFGKNKKDNTPPPAPAPKPAVKVEMPPPAKPMNADDFFGDLDRKKRKKEVSFDIDTPEVTGLREAPPAPPKKIFKDVDTDTLSMNGLHEDGYTPEDMKNFRGITADENAVDALRDKSHDNDIPFDPDAPAQPAPMAAFDPNDPDAFFKAIDRKANRRQKFAIDVPEVTGLREDPLAAPGDTVAEIDLSLINTDVLNPEPPRHDGAEYGNIATISAVVPDDL